MPKNRFPDSRAKRELRRVDARRIHSFREQLQLHALSYCGMPSVEFLDVLEWAPDLYRVAAVEYERDVLDDMRLQWKNLAVPLECHFHPGNIYDYLRDCAEVFDLYNLDFYGGFLNRKGDGSANATDALAAMIARQGGKKRSFILVATFHARQNLIEDYDGLIDKVSERLSGYKNAKANGDQHKKNSIYRTKIGYCYFCRTLGASHGFTVRFEDVFTYQSSVPLIHFYCEFMHSPRSLPEPASAQSLIEIANMPVKEMQGMARKVIFRPIQIESPS
jgi:hypothetical protein